jgi:hypothetical protein
MGHPPVQCTALYDEIAGILKHALENPWEGSQRKRIGFTTVANPQQGEKEGKVAADGR